MERLIDINKMHEFYEFYDYKTGKSKAKVAEEEIIEQSHIPLNSARSINTMDKE